MTGIDHIDDVIKFGGCVVMGVRVTPERYRSLLQDTTNQDYLVIGPKDSVDAGFIVVRMSGDRLKPTPIVVFDLEMDAYLIKSDKSAG